MDKLKDYNDYHDVAIQFECESKIADSKLYRDITDRIILDLDFLSDTFTEYFEGILMGDIK